MRKLFHFGVIRSLASVLCGVLIFEAIGYKMTFFPLVYEDMINVRDPVIIIKSLHYKCKIKLYIDIVMNV